MNNFAYISPRRGGAVSLTKSLDAMSIDSIAKCGGPTADP
jgi:hypothetical protein